MPSTTFNKFTQWTRSLVYAGYTVTQFASSFVSGGPVVEGFLSSLENLSSSVLKYSETAFNKATENEVNRLAAGGAISNSFTKKVNFDEGLELFDQIRVKLAKSAASLPGTTADYITVFRSLSDDMATALNSAGAGGKELKQLFRDKVPQAVEKLVLQTKLYGQDIPVSSITKTYSKLLSTGKINPREIFVQRNPVLRTGIEAWEKENGKKLPSLNIRERFEALNKIFADSISTDQMTGLTNSFQAKVETLKSYLFDPDVGLFGFEREFKTAGGETTTLFKELSKAIGPVLDKFATLAQNVVTYGDPFAFLTTVFNNTLGPELNKFTENIGVLNQTIQVTDGDFQAKLKAGLKAAFNFDFDTFDFAGAITTFFDKIAKFIETFGDNIKPDDRLGQAMSAALSGLFKVIGAILTRIARQVQEHPIETTQFIALTNPGLIFQAFTAFATSLIVIIPLISLVSSAFMTMLSWTGFLPIITSVFGALVNIAGAILGALAWPLLLIAGIAAMVIFRDRLLSAGKYFQELGDNMTGPFKNAFSGLGVAMTLLGEAGQALADAWNNFASGDWRGAVVDLFHGLVKTISGLFVGLGAGFSAAGDAIKIAWDGMLPTLLKLGAFIVDGFVNTFTGQKSLNQLTDNVSAAKVISTPNGNLLDNTKDALKTWSNRWGAILGTGDIFQNASGNTFGNLLATISAERRDMPAGASIAIANSSEAIISRPKAMEMLSSEAIISRPKAMEMLSSSGPSSGKSVTIGGINIYVTGSNASATDIGEEVRRQLIDLLT
jgi:hypothetical protein